MSDDRPFYAPGQTVEPTPIQPRRVLERLWTLTGPRASVTCVVVEHPHGEELRVLRQGELLRSDVYPSRFLLLERAEQIRRDYLAFGWTAEP